MHKTLRVVSERWLNRCHEPDLKADGTLAEYNHDSSSPTHESYS